MLAALLTLLLINLALRGIVWCVRAFLRWMDDGPQLRRLVDEGLIPQERVESAEAADIRKFVDACDEWRREMRLGRRTRADRPRLTREQRRVVREHREASSSIDLSEQTNRSERTSSVSASSARSTSANTMSGWVVWEPFLPSSSSFCSA